jgi:hypothetical protein
VGDLALGDDCRGAHRDTAVWADHIREECGRNDLDIEIPRVTLSPNCFDLSDHRVNHRRRQPSADSGNEPDRCLPDRCCRSNRRRTERHDGAIGIDRQSLDQNNVGKPSDRACSASIDRFVFNVTSFEVAYKSRGGVSDIEREHTNVAAPHETLSDNIWIPDGHNRCPVGERCGQFCCGSVGADFRGQFPDRLEWFGRGGDAGAKPQEGSIEGMTLNDPSARNNQPG